MERRAVTIQDVASRAQVSIATVSRVLNDSGYPMRPDTKRRVLEAIDALSFRPSSLARGLLGKPTRTIGLIIPDISNPYYPQLCRGVEDVAVENGYAVIFCNTDRSQQKIQSYIDVLQEKQADGVIFTGGGVESGEELGPLEGLRDKVVVTGRHNGNYPSVQVDNTRAAYDATFHLLSLRHRRIAFISGPHGLTSSDDRLRGFRQAMAKACIEVNEQFVREGDFRFESGYLEAKAILSGPGERPTALFAANDRMALGAMSAAYDLGIRVPEDLSMVGYDNTLTAQYVRPSLTTVSLPYYEMGATSARLLLRLLAGGTVQSTVWLPTQLVIRQSSGDPIC
ncbi:MAG TPA: LacI family DNA-binding transcriptional regulator [Chloroflexota bacterium]|nr:LacI family DNA-binding transcriptional regulator [Chloroflexota bacterium]